MKNTRTFPDMVKIIPASERQPGRFYIEHMVVDNHASMISSFNRGPYSYVSEGTYCGLKRASENGNSSWDSLWMSDTQMERATNHDIVRQARGDVLIIGLGLGMVPYALCRKPEVTSVTVLELEPEVIALVAPHVTHKKLRVICADGRQPPLRGRLFDTIYLDIWTNISSDNWKDMKPLLALYRKFRRAGGLVTGWLKEYVQREWKNEKKDSWRW